MGTPLFCKFCYLAILVLFSLHFWRNILRLNSKTSNSSITDSPTFCMMPWVHLHVTQYGTVTPCCQAPWQEEHAFGDINTQPIKDIWQGSKMNAFRKSMLEGKADKRCESCFTREKSGFTSLRNITNFKYQHKRDLVASTSKAGEIGKVMPVYLDIRFSNVCNLKCRMCGPWSSSSWFNDAVKLGMIKEQASPLTYSFKKVSSFFLQFEELIPGLEELYFAGGEPIVMEEHYRLLELLIDRHRTDVRLTYNTNFSGFTFKHYNVFEVWKQFKTISIAASLDASGTRGEFLRKNLKWSDVVHNRRVILKELPHIEFVVSATLNIYNCLHLPDFHKDWTEQGLIQVEDFIPTLLVQPKALSVSILPNAFKRKAIEKYASHRQWILSQPYKNKEKHQYMLSQFENIVRVLSVETTVDDMDLFRKNSAAMDKIRDENTSEVFPELMELFQ